MKEENFCIKFKYRNLAPDTLDIRKILNKFKSLMLAISPDLIDMDIRGCI